MRCDTNPRKRALERTSRMASDATNRLLSKSVLIVRGGLRPPRYNRRTSNIVQTYVPADTHSVGRIASDASSYNWSRRYEWACTMLSRGSPIRYIAYRFSGCSSSSFRNRQLVRQKHALIGVTLTGTEKRAAYPANVASCGIVA